ncbi:uncharacterized protein LOC133173571 [Saccostrea echinata]|uniref:uncharacterized protein LOC133173571 n=1 Tax=Saccostrea echinata TaxID=191078 RepID=UPI002A810629|nr:uncharacterized protein LOC133173571 [Saccostrea echinata]
MSSLDAYRRSEEGECACTLPSLWDGQWWDSSSGEVTFTHSTQLLTGWRIQAYTSVITSWTCVNQNSSSFLLFRGNQYLDLFSSDVVAFRCVRYVRITDYSYYYYIFGDEQLESNKQRYEGKILSTSPSEDLSARCQPPNGPSGEEYHVLVKKGFERSVKQWCPVPLLGTFSYIHDTGSVVNCVSGSEVSACPDWTYLAFNYSQCSTIQAFSAAGRVQCVATVQYNSTLYTTVFNPETVTDTTNYDKFSCLAISKSGDTVYISDAKGSCENGQSSQVKATRGSGTLVLTEYSRCYGGCDFPDAWDSEWYDSSHGDIILNRNYSAVSEGWSIPVYETSILSWTCFAENTSASYFLFKGDQIPLSSGIRQNVFRCVRWEKLTTYSYSYYILAGKNSNAANNRVITETQDVSVTSWTTSDYCQESASPPVEEFHVIVMKGREVNAKQWCPVPLLGNFTYTHNDGISTTCGSLNSDLNVCPSWSIMTFNYTMCSTVQGFSDEGILYCLKYVLKGSTIYLSVLNPGVVDNTATHRFTCYALTESGDTVYMSDSKGSCEAGQSPTVKAPDGSGTLQLESTERCYGSCTFPVTWDGSWYDSGMGEITLSYAVKTVSGWSVNINSTEMTSWTCQSQNASEGIMLFRANDLLNIKEKLYNVFRCIRTVKLTNYSYTYYVMNDIMEDAGFERIQLTEYSPDVTNWDVNSLCSPMAPAEDEEYYMLVKQGHDTEVKQWCPIPLRGDFNYTHDTGLVTSCGLSSSLTACPDWVTLQFNYSLCPTIQAFSKEGIVNCVHTVVQGDTYFTSVFNPGHVDGVNFRRFTCLAVTEMGGIVTVSDSAGNCQANQTSHSKQADGSGILTLTVKESCYGSCTLPTQWIGDWYDSFYGQLTFSGTSLAGWKLTSYSSIISSWSCVAEDTSNNYLLFLGDQRVDLFGTQQNMFRCIKWKKITDNSYYYYARADVEANANNARVKVEFHNPSVTSWNAASYCNPSSGPGPEEYHVLLKKGSELLTKQWCPIPLLGTFRYIHNDGSTDVCSADSQMNVCPSWTTIYFDYTKCSNTQAFSQEGIVYCVNTVQNGDVYYTTLYNPGVVDNSLYHRFTCYSLSESSSSFYVSDSPGICEAGQAPSTKASDGSGLLTLNRTYSCHVETNAGNHRVLVEKYDPSVNRWDPASYCNPTSPPGKEEYHVLVKAGFTNEVKQWCPVPLLGKFTYQHNDGSSVTCSSSSDVRVCPDWTTMTFNYSLCSTVQSFSQEGNVHCIHSITSGSTYYVTVFNPGFVDGTQYHRFSCYALASSGSVLHMSDSAGSCEMGQSPTVKQSDGSGTLTLTSYGRRITSTYNVIPSMPEHK